MVLALGSPVGMLRFCKIFSLQSINLRTHIVICKYRFYCVLWMTPQEDVSIRNRRPPKVWRRVSLQLDKVPTKACEWPSIPTSRTGFFWCFFGANLLQLQKLSDLGVYIYIYISMDLCMLWIAHAYRLYAYITSFRSDRCTSRLCTQGMLQSWSCVGAASATFKKKNLAQRHSICLAQDSSPVEGQMRRLTVRASRRCNFYRLDLSKQQPRDLKFSVEQSFFL